MLFEKESAFNAELFRKISEETPQMIHDGFLFVVKNEDKKGRSGAGIIKGAPDIVMPTRKLGLELKCYRKDTDLQHFEAQLHWATNHVSRGGSYLLFEGMESKDCDFFAHIITNIYHSEDAPPVVMFAGRTAWLRRKFAKALPAGEIVDLN